MRSTSVAFSLTLAAVLAPAQEDVRTRNLWDSTFLQHRPAAVKNPSTAARPPSATTAAAPDADAFIGFTVWRLRQSRSTDEPRVRLFVHDDGAKKPWTPERVDLGTPLEEGQKVRFSIESART